MHDSIYSQYFPGPFKHDGLFIKAANDENAFLWSSDFSVYFKTIVIRKMNDDKSIKFDGRFTLHENAIYFNNLRILEPKGISVLMDNFKLQPSQAWDVVNEMTLECITSLNE